VVPVSGTVLAGRRGEGPGQHDAVPGIRYFSLPGGGTAYRTGAGTAYGYEIDDQQGTNLLTLDYTAQVPAWRQQAPYGASRGASVSWVDNRAFLDKPADAATGLDIIGARSYDPVTGRFASLGPVLEKTSPQLLNGYSYTAGNPVTSSDPTGAQPVCDEPCPPPPPPPGDSGSGTGGQGAGTANTGDGGGGGGGVGGPNMVSANCGLASVKAAICSPDAGLGPAATGTHGDFMAGFGFSIASLGDLACLPAVLACIADAQAGLLPSQLYQKHVNDPLAINTSSEQYQGGEAFGAFLTSIIPVGEAADAATAAGSEQIAARDIAPDLSAYAGGKTSGVLVRSDGSQVPLQSGYDGPALGLPKPRPGMNGNIVSHVEAHAAAIMRSEGLGEATLYINRAPCPGVNGCMLNVSCMVPSGSTMNIYVMTQGSAANFEDWIRVIGTG
jgi:RHS repeat-associated protein